MLKGIYYTLFEYQDWKQSEDESMKGDLGKFS